MASDDEAGDVERRLQRLEDQQEELRDGVQQARADAGAARVLAAGADRDVSEVRSELRAHTRSLTALRDTQREMAVEMQALGVGLRELRAEVGGLRAEVGGLNSEVGGLERRMTDGFATVHTGMRHITVLLERALGPGRD